MHKVIFHLCMIKTPKRHCRAMSSNYMPNLVNVSEVIFTLWPYNQSGTPACTACTARLPTRPYARRHWTNNFSKSDNDTLRQILAKGKKCNKVTQCSLPTSRFSISRTSLIHSAPMSPQKQVEEELRGLPARGADAHARTPPRIERSGCIPGQDPPF